MTDGATADTLVGRGLGRRQFIAAAGTVAATYYVLGPNGVAEQDGGGALGTVARAAGRTLSVGYVAGSHAFKAGAGAALRQGARVVPAMGLRSGDAGLQGAAQIGVLGTTAGVSHAVAAGLTAVHLDALVPAPRPLDQDTALPFYAWSLTASPLVRQSPPVSFAASFERTPRLGFSVDTPGTGLAPGTAAFTLGRHSGMAKLRQGLYLLALGEGVWDRERVLPDPADEGAWQGLASLLVSVAPAA